MGKIRVKTLGVEELEEKQKKEALRKATGKQQRKEAQKVNKVPGLKGGQRVVAVGPSEEELAALEVPQVSEVSQGDEKKTRDTRGTRGTRATRPPRKRGRKYQSARMLVEPNKVYSLTEALELLPKLLVSTFDETVELHINTNGQGVSATVTLPHGTGKKTRVAIANDKLIEEVEKGKIDFDVLLAEPSMMPKLAKVAKFLGPRGLMPNPKAGTITDKPEEVAKKYEGGQMTFKTESKAPVMHLTVGKISFGKEKLEENIKTALSAIQAGRIKKTVLKSTMSPGIKVDFAKI